MHLLFSPANQWIGEPTNIFLPDDSGEQRNEREANTWGPADDHALTRL